LDSGGFPRELSVQLVRSLFCGLPRKDKRVAVVLSASDETYRGSFCYCGLVAPVSYWEGIFAKRWNKRVLSGPPTIPYLHMTEIRSPEWRKENNISAVEAERRVDCAIDVICKRKHPSLFSFKFDKGIFDQRVKRKVRKPTGAAIKMGPEYLGFIGYALVVIESVKKAIPDTERVDFLVEKNGPFTTNLQYFYDAFPRFFKSVGKDELIPLLGEIIPGGKDRSPLQAADVFCWHLRRESEKSLSGVDLKRWEKLVQKPK
jgi:hypothetical protein